MVVLACLLVLSGCVQRTLFNQQIRAARRGRVALETQHDFEVAKAGALSGLSQLEVLHQLAPHNEDALLMLTQAWAGTAQSFIHEEYELACEQHDPIQIRYQQDRTRAAHTRALYFGNELLSRKASGFGEAQKNASDLEQWLARHFVRKADAEALLWTGFAWLGRAAVSREQPEVLAERYVGVALLERSVTLDETAAHALGHTVLGGYYAASGSPDVGYQHLQRALQLTGQRSLPARLVLATGYYCALGDRGAYEATLQELVAAGDIWPEARFSNLVAMRKARRYLLHPMWQADCRF